MATLSLLTAMAPTERPSGETLEEQERRISDGINLLLADPRLWSAGWQLQWVGLTNDRANMAFIALTGDPVTFVLSVRGTVFTSLKNLAQDLKIWEQVAFPFGGMISQGAQSAFAATLDARCVLDDVAGIKDTNLTAALTELTKGISAPVIYVTGHSLGGALSTTLTLQLSSSMSQAKLRPYTFAAPTAGDPTFAAAFDRGFPNAVCMWNHYDAVPHAWANLRAVEDFFPHPGPAASSLEKDAIELVDDLRCGNHYTQPAQQPALNESYSVHGPAQNDFVDELVFGHAGNTYLRLLGAPTIDWRIPDVADVTVEPAKNDSATVVEITPTAGTTFTSDCVVDTGLLDNYVPAVSVTVAPDGTSIRATLSPDSWPGEHAAYVTNVYGTSSAASFSI